jgi:hypothetical protein
MTSRLLYIPARWHETVCRQANRTALQVNILFTSVVAAKASSSIFIWLKASFELMLLLVKPIFAALNRVSLGGNMSSVSTRFSWRVLVSFALVRLAEGVWFWRWNVMVSCLYFIFRQLASEDEITNKPRQLYRNATSTWRSDSNP